MKLCDKLIILLLREKYSKTEFGAKTYNYEFAFSHLNKHRVHIIKAIKQLKKELSVQ